MLLPIKKMLLNMEQHASWPNSPVRQLTPPDSPRNEIMVLPSIRTLHLGQSQTQEPKMSLDFIAPGSRSPTPETNTTRMLPPLEIMSIAAESGSKHYSSSSSFMTSSTHAGPTSWSQTPNNSPSHYHRQPCSYDDHFHPPASLPSPTWSYNSEPHHKFPSLETMHIGPPSHLHHHQPRRLSINISQLHSHPHHTRSHPYPSNHRVEKHKHASKSNPATRVDRPQYDAEERYALVYLRREGISQKIEWKTVRNLYLSLFPPATTRRYKSKAADAKNLPDVYPSRDIQGLQCRMYRIRTDMGLPKSREVVVGDVGAAERVRAEEMEKLDDFARANRLSRAFLRRVEVLAASKDDE